MMRAVKIYMIIAVTLMKTTLGLPQNCIHYCNFSPEKSSTPPGCDCSIHNLRKTRLSTSKHIATLPEIQDTGIYPVKLNFSQNTSFEQTWHSINPIYDSKRNTFKGAKKELLTANTGVSVAEQYNYDETHSKSSNQNEKRETYFPQLNGEVEVPLHLYLDIDITSENNNRPQLEELKNMFENFQAAEKNLSECINLHFYIFSKHIDTINTTNTNWGQKVQNDNLSSFQQLTEIHNKCDQPASIIKKSIYQIKQFLSREDKTAELTHDVQETIYTAGYKDVRAQKATNEFADVNATTRDMYPDALTIDPTDDIYNNYNAATETVDVVADKTHNITFHKKKSDHDNHNLFYNHLLVKNNSNITLTPSFYEDSTEYDKIKLLASDHATDYGDLETTSKRDRTILSEKDIKIPRILSKELSNGTLVSVVDGYEKIPNSDFINNSVIATPSNTESNSNLDKIVQSDIVNIHGNLYFSFGEKQIPARFIQQPDGEVDVAIDGFSMCDQILENNTSNFMNSLCKCIKHKTCT